MIARRRMLTGAVTLGLGAPALAQTNGAAARRPVDVAFDVTRDGSHIGRHAITFQTDGPALTARISVDIVVTFGPVTLYRYELKATEIWRGGVFQTLDGETNSNGTPLRVRAVRGPEGLTVDATGQPRTVFPAETLPLSHWNILCTERPLFNLGDGTAIGAKARALGEETVTLANGQTVAASHYALAGKVNLDDWYDRENTWTALKTLGRDGSRIEYRRLT